ncbi:MAG: aminoacylase [Flammeovirgaceae bacterium]|nr:aminoacylase [Flammeovirgaceae bacterium]|tara:strand:- start:1895 stop:3514 length:1620 start_codon:yes stop_codon:yes gene_type:complete
MKKYLSFLILLSILVFSCDYKSTEPIVADIVIYNGMIYDGSGEKPYLGSVAIKEDKIIYVGENTNFESDTTIDATGLSVSPGFINMLSWGYGTLMEDGRGLSDLLQGVTLEIFGEGRSPGPYYEDGKLVSFGDAMSQLEKSGVSMNIASFLGAATTRILGVGYENRDATDSEMKKMKEIVRKSMEEGAMGIGSSLIYAPGDYASTQELIELSKSASEYGGMYISHLRSEGAKLLEALDELITISREADIPSEIYHLKASREPNWPKLDEVISIVEDARAEGLQITADIYTYNASSTGLTGVIPTWVQEGGHDAWIKRMKDPSVRPRLLNDIREQLAEQPPEGILMVGFNTPEMSKKYLAKTVAEAAKMRGQSPEEAIVDMVIEDNHRIQCIYFSMSEENIRKKIQLPWVSFCSDAGIYSDISKSFRTHPRAFGSFIRVLGKYSRDENLFPLEEGIRRLTSYPAQNLKLKNRGMLKESFFADVVIFNAEKVNDNATFEEPLQFSEGVDHVLVNGVPVLLDGEHTNKFSGRFVRGPGYIKN